MIRPVDLRYYERYSGWAGLVFAWNALWSRSKARKQSLLNRQKDYYSLAHDERLLRLHLEINRHLVSSWENWGDYDYGESYFYQSLDTIGVSGLRDTRARVEAMGLSDLVRGRQVLEIGCNCGFLSLTIADAARQVTGLDINPHLIKVARRVAGYLGRENLDFIASSFEDYSNPDSFDVVLSFANHATYDGNTRQTVDEYFRRCYELVRPGGWLLFESHPPAHEGDGLAEVCSIIGELFVIEQRRVLQYGTFLDRDRTFMVARRA